MSNKDCRGVKRGECQNCNICEMFLAEKGTFMCAYCGCPPAKHEIEEVKDDEPSKLLQPATGASTNEEGTS